MTCRPKRRTESVGVRERGADHKEYYIIMNIISHSLPNIIGPMISKRRNGGEEKWL
jgi:hypothetical protein